DTTNTRPGASGASSAPVEPTSGAGRAGRVVRSVGGHDHVLPAAHLEVPDPARCPLFEAASADGPRYVAGPTTASGPRPSNEWKRLLRTDRAGGVVRSVRSHDHVLPVAHLEVPDVV